MPVSSVASWFHNLVVNAWWIPAERPRTLDRLWFPGQMAGTDSSAEYLKAEESAGSWRCAGRNECVQCRVEEQMPRNSPCRDSTVF